MIRGFCNDLCVVSNPLDCRRHVTIGRLLGLRGVVDYTRFGTRRGALVDLHILE